MVRRKGREFTLTSPSGEVFTGTNVTKFAEERGLDRNLLIRVLNGDRQVHQGWTCPGMPIGFRHKPHMHRIGENRKRGTHHPNAKLKREDVIDIRQNKKGETAKELASRFSVHKNTIDRCRWSEIYIEV